LPAKRHTRRVTASFMTLRSMLPARSFMKLLRRLPGSRRLPAPGPRRLQTPGLSRLASPGLRRLPMPGRRAARTEVQR
jgi:hypothetical protein